MVGALTFAGKGCIGLCAACPCRSSRQMRSSAVSRFTAVLSIPLHTSNVELDVRCNGQYRDITSERPAIHGTGTFLWFEGFAYTVSYLYNSTVRNTRLKLRRAYSLRIMPRSLYFSHRIWESIACFSRPHTPWAAFSRPLHD